MPNLNQAGIMDLSTLKSQPSAAPAGGGGRYVVEVTDADFDTFVRRSGQYPLVVEFYSPRARAEQMSALLEKLAAEADGKYLLGRINVDTETKLAQELQITGVPLVAGVVGGQLVPLWQGTTDEAQARAVIDQLLQLAAQNGIMGRAEAQATAPAAGDDAAEQAADPRFAAADAALEAGDYAKAREEFDALLAQTPNDPEVIAGRAQAGLLARTQGANPEAAIQAADAAPDDVDRQLEAADLEVLMGMFDAGFARLIGVVRDHPGDDRDRARKRLLELFETVGNADPTVLKARRDLTSALF